MESADIIEGGVPPPGFVPPISTAMTITCSVCHYVIQDSWYFCPNCGNKLKKSPPSTSFAKQLQVYLISIFIPPFGLVPAVRYLSSKDSNAKLVGVVCLLLTILSTVITIWSSIYLINMVQSAANQELNPLSNLQDTGGSQQNSQEENILDGL